MKKLLSILSASLVACTLASCSSSSESVGDEPMFQQDSAGTASSESASASGSSSNTTAQSGDESAKGDKPTDVKERDPQDFMAGGDLATIPNPIPAVKSPDGRSICLIYEEAEGPMCKVEFADPPIYPSPVGQSWKSNAVSFRNARGFFPVWAIEFYQPTEVASLNEGEKVSFGDTTFEATGAKEFTVKNGDHSFTLKDDGQYYSDTFPAKPGADGVSNTGTVCGESATRGDASGTVYVQEDNTNCNDAMKLLEEYVNDDWESGEGGDRGEMSMELGTCGLQAPKVWGDKVEYRFLTCSPDSGGSVVVLTPENMKNLL